ncbi:MAG: CrcB family protein [Actinomycetota bacterium]
MSAIVTGALFAIAAAGGAIGRHLVHQVAATWAALLAVNIVGSALLGALVAADLSTATTTVLGVGFCGALTTYSSFALEVRRLGWRWGPPYAIVTAAAAIGAAAVAATAIG